VAPIRDIKAVDQVTVEAYQLAIERGARGDRANPESAETADHSIPYLVAVTLRDGKVTRRSFTDVNLWNPELRALMGKVRVFENEDFTRAYEGTPVEHRMRVTVLLNDGAQFVGESGGDEEDLSRHMSDSQIEAKFMSISEDVMPAAQARTLIEQLWHLEDLEDIADIPRAAVIV
jgi:2-methylcitrate dehydratase